MKRSVLKKSPAHKELFNFPIIKRISNSSNMLTGTKIIQGVWFMYGCILVGIACVYFGHLVDHPFDTDDDLYMEDSRSIVEEPTLIFSPEQLLPGRPLTELVFLAGYLARGNDAGFFHLLVVAIHVLTSLAISYASHRLGATLATSLLGGLFFLINVAHLRAVYWISAMCYPLALFCISISIILLTRNSGSRNMHKAVWATAMLGMAVFAHPAAIFCLPLIYHVLQPNLHLKRVQISLIGMVISGCVGAVIIWTTYPQVAQNAQSDLSAGVLGMLQTQLLLLGRLVSSAHWIPGTLYSIEWWEYYLGAIVLLLLCGAFWFGNRQIGFWSIWTIVSAIPFATRPPDFFTSGAFDPLGMSRYLYFASAGSSFLLAQILGSVWRCTDRHLLRQVSHFLVTLSVTLLFIVSFTSFKMASASSWFSSGRHNYFRGHFDKAREQLLNALPGHEFVVPHEMTYYYLVDIELLEGKIPETLISTALDSYPHSGLLQLLGTTINSLSPDPETRRNGRRNLHVLLNADLSPDQLAILTNRAVRSYRIAGLGFYNQEASEWAAYALRQALNLAPDDPAVHTLYGQVLESDKDLEGAQRHYRRALEFETDTHRQTDLLKSLARISYTRNELQNSLNLLRKALALEPGDAEGFAILKKLEAALKVKATDK